MTQDIDKKIRMHPCGCILYFWYDVFGLLLVHAVHAFLLQAFLFLLESFQLGHQAALCALVALLLLHLSSVSFEDSKQLRFVGSLAEYDHDQDTNQTGNEVVVVQAR